MQPVPRQGIFVCSSHNDLVPYRAAVLAVLQDLGYYPVAMEHFGARDEDITTTSLAAVAEAHAVLCIVAWRYGTPLDGGQESVTHQEYHEALRLKRPTYLFLAADATEQREDLFPAASRNPAYQAQLLALRAELQRAKPAAFFTTPDELAKQVAVALGRAPVRLVPRLLPPRVAGFTGREPDLRHLEATLRRGQSVGLAAAVTGMGGVGKTALATEVAHHLAEDPAAFPGGQVWLTALEQHGPTGLATLYDQVLSAWNVRLEPTELPTNLSEEAGLAARERIIHQRLPVAGPGLVIIDNAEADLPLGRLLDTLRAKRLTVLVTSRIVFALPALQIRRLDVLPPEEAVALFAERHIAQGGHWDGARDQVATLGVVDALGYLPLAIELAAARAARLGLTTARLEAQLREPGVLEKLRNPTDPAASARYLLERNLGDLAPTTRDGFALLSQLSGTTFPQALLLDTFNGLDPAEGTADQTWDQLSTWSLLTPATDDDRNEAIARLHPLLREMATDHWRALSPKRQAELIPAVLDATARYAQAHRQDFATLRRWEALLVAALRHPQGRAGAPDALIDLTLALNDYLDLQGRWAIDQEVLEQLVQLYWDREDRAGEGGVLGNLGILAMNQGHYDEAAAYYAQGMAIARELGDRAGEAAVLSNLGLLAMRQGRYDEAATYYAQSLKILRELSDRTGEGRVLGNLGLLARNQGRYDEAAAYYSQHLAIARELGDRAGEGVVLGNLGVLAMNQGRYDEAADYYAQSLKILRELGDRAGEGAVLGNLGVLAWNQGRYDEAAAYYSQHLAIARELGDRAGEGRVLGNLGSLATNQDRYDEAAAYHSQHLAIARELGDRAREGLVLGNLGSLATKQGRYDEAAAYFAQSLAILEPIGSADAQIFKQNQAILERLLVQQVSDAQAGLPSLEEDQAVRVAPPDVLPLAPSDKGVSKAPRRWWQLFGGGRQ